MVNAKHDTASYENCGYQREIFDGNVLYESFLQAKRGSSWKPAVQKYEMNYLIGLSKVQRELREGTYEFKPTSDFVLRERGKTRYISGETFEDRIVKHALCDEALMPSLRPRLIYDNCASLKGRGISMQRKRLLTHLRKYYREHGTNDGYILLIDYSKYYDNIRHEDFFRLVRESVSDPVSLNLLRKVLDRERIDVSYLSDAEYGSCMNTVFSSLEYAKIDKGLLTGEKLMPKHLNIGDQVAQVAGISYPIPIDNYVKIVRQMKYYGRYTDDSYIIHESREVLEDVLKGILEIAGSIGITVSRKKTRICKLSDKWRFLQIQYSLTDTGRVIQKINPKRLACMRRKMKKAAQKGHLTPKEFENWYRSWFRAHYKIMSRAQRNNMDKLYNQLKEINRNVQNNS